MINRTDIVKVAREYIGTKFQHQGRIKQQGIGNLGGVDCVGIILGVAKELEIPLIILPDFERYGRRARGKPLLEYMDEQFTWRNNREMGSIMVSFHDSRTKEPSHLGVITDVGVIHTSGILGVVIEQYWSDLLEEKVVAYYDYSGVV